MTCDKLRQHRCGEITAEEFGLHCEECPECREASFLDARIEQAAQELPVPTATPGLWDRIAADLRREQARTEREAVPSDWPGRQRPHRRWLDMRQPVVWRLAAVLAIAIGLGALLLIRPFQPTPQPRNLLTERALEQVERIEDQYIQAIAQLEELATPVLATVDTELMLRYRQRLEIIDTQIRRCQTVLDQDGANAHVRRYLLVAYQDKKETLTELLALAEG